MSEVQILKACPTCMKMVFAVIPFDKYCYICQTKLISFPEVEKMKLGDEPTEKELQGRGDE